MIRRLVHGALMANLALRDGNRQTNRGQTDKRTPEPFKTWLALLSLTSRSCGSLDAQIIEL